MFWEITTDPIDIKKIIKNTMNNSMPQNLIN